MLPSPLPQLTHCTLQPMRPIILAGPERLLVRLLYGAVKNVLLSIKKRLCLDKEKQSYSQYSKTISCLIIQIALDRQ